MRVAIVELYEHWELVDFLRGVLHGHHLRYWLSTAVAAHPALADLRGVSAIVPEGERASALPAVLATASELDVLIVCTRNVDHRPWERLPELPIPAVLLLHDAAFGFDPHAERAGGPLSRLRRWRWRLAGSWSRRLLSGRTPWAGFASSAPGAEDYLSGLGERRPCLVAPYAYVASGAEAPASPRRRGSRQLHVVLPGSVDPEHRDYATVLEALRQYRGRPLLLSVPGVPRGRQAARVLSEFESLDGDRVRVTTRRTTAHLDYRAALAEADVLLVPIRRHVYYATQRETVGRSKGLGALDDQVRYAKPALVPDGIPLWPRLSPVTTRYATAEALSRVLADYRPPVDRRCFAPFHLTAVSQRWTSFLEGLPPG